MHLSGPPSCAGHRSTIHWRAREIMVSPSLLGLNLVWEPGLEPGLRTSKDRRLTLTLYPDDLVENDGIEPLSQRHRFYRPPQVPACYSLSEICALTRSSVIPRLGGLHGTGPDVPIVKRACRNPRSRTMNFIVQ